MPYIQGSQGVFNLYKHVGETPLERLERFKKKHTEYRNVPMMYAGRLDPMAEGVLIAIAGEERFNKNEYLGLDKEYEFEILWGFFSDTFDALGKVEFVAVPSENVDVRATEAMTRLVGTRMQPYPPFSSQTVGGKPLFQWARENGAFPPDAMPEKTVTVHSLKLVGGRMFSRSELEAEIKARILSVHGDFRQSVALDSWKMALRASKMEQFTLARSIAAVSSGTYIRSIIDSIGKELGCGALAFSILRTRVGKWMVGESEP
jgi:tRNA pseudouridine(55) synthase